ncbi:30S ribosomal protein S16 [Labeo rohita]|uniref:30S ribosomal protein S16 n=1 Tax=Labeo rohita TaxID=84645 RepID=A0ABQ8L516_LABRO|nr:30S ribosomal protein S16 [Labeo rohita]
MVSQSSSVGYTIMGKTADLTVVQKTTIDTLHKEGKTQKVIAKEAGCSQSSGSKHINREVKGRKRCGRKKCTSNRDNRTLERIVKQNPFKNVGEIHKENHYTQTYARHGFQLSHSLCQATLEQQTASEASRLG